MIKDITRGSRAEDSARIAVRLQSVGSLRSHATCSTALRSIWPAHVADAQCQESFRNRSA